jgi:hypothetical protein
MVGFLVASPRLTQACCGAASCRSAIDGAAESRIKQGAFDGAREGFLWQSCIAWGAGVGSVRPLFQAKNACFSRRTHSGVILNGS